MQETEEGSFISSVWLLYYKKKKKVRKVLKLCSSYFFFPPLLGFESEKNAGSHRRPGWNRVLILPYLSLFVEIPFVSRPKSLNTNPITLPNPAHWSWSSVSETVFVALLIAPVDCSRFRRVYSVPFQLLNEVALMNLFLLHAGSMGFNWFSVK